MAINSFCEQRDISASSLVVFLSCVMSISIFGCGSGKSLVVDVSAPTITMQPSSQTVPLGSVAMFSVIASGSTPLSYQWANDNQPISGATESTYTIPAVATEDQASIYSVTVKNRYGQVTSAPVKISVGPRSPKAGDLRFQQVDASSTVNGYTGQYGTDLGPLQVLTFGAATGIPLSVGPGCAIDPNPSPMDCVWVVNVFNLPPGVTGLSTGYGDYVYSSMPSVLTEFSTGDTVITGFDLQAAYNSFAISWIKGTSNGVFDRKSLSVPLPDAQAAAAQEGLLGRVITAVSFNLGQIAYLSYGWSAESSTKYETSVITTSKPGASVAASSLASQGYIITAVGGNDVDGVILVGTKVKGDTLPRPFLVIPDGQSTKPLTDGGYAIVGVIATGQQFIAWMGEK